MIVTRATQRGSAGTAFRRSLDKVREHLAGSHETLKAVASAGHHLGVPLLNLATAYGPGCIVLGGSVIKLGAQFLQPTLNVPDAHATFGGSSRPKVRTSRFGQNAVAPDRRPRRLTPSYNKPVPLSSPLDQPLSLAQHNVR